MKDVKNGSQRLSNLNIPTYVFEVERLLPSNQRNYLLGKPIEKDIRKKKYRQEKQIEERKT